MSPLRPVRTVIASVRDLMSHASRHPVGLLGANLVMFSVVLFLFFLVVELIGVETNPYIGILAYLVLPGLFVLGIVLIIIGRRLYMRQKEAQGRAPFAIIDLNRPDHRRRLNAVLIMSALSLMILGVAGFQAVHYMDSSEFCGLVCHRVMIPEYTAYEASPHARVECVDCHIGPGAGWFVKSKLSGLRQVVAVTFNTYHRPLPNPVHNLRPARETCEQCHWPAKFHGDRVKVKKGYATDRDNTELTTMLLLKVGGGSLESGFAEGIHWHMNIANRVEYIADSTRTDMYWVGVTDPAGNTTEYVKQGLDFDPKSRPGLERRLLDCMDCHNRPTHAFEPMARAVNDAIWLGAIPRTLPYIRREAERVLAVEYPDRKTAFASIEQEILAFYRDSEPGQNPAQVDRAIEAIKNIYGRNVFPEMKVTWGTYPNHIGHESSPGCFRCHDEQHVSADGKTISQECTNCHHLLAIEEANPEIVSRLYAE